MARVPTPMNWGLVTPKERRDFIESHDFSPGGLRSILAEEAAANAEWHRRHARNRALIAVAFAALGGLMLVVAAA